MPVDRRRLLSAGGAGLVLLFVAWWLWPAASIPAPAGVQSEAARARGAKPAVPSAAVPVTAIKLDALKASHDEPGEASRNPFRFQPKVVPPPPRPVAPPPSAVVDVPKPVVPTGPPPPPPIPLKLIGVLERANGVKWAVLTDGKSPPMYGKDGDIIDGRYTIVKIGTESVEMTHADGRGRQVIRLTGQ